MKHDKLLSLIPHGRANAAMNGVLDYVQRGGGEVS